MRELAFVLVLGLMLLPAFAAECTAPSGLTVGAGNPGDYLLPAGTNDDICIDINEWKTCPSSGIDIVDSAGYQNYLCFGGSWIQCSSFPDFRSQSGKGYYCNTTSWKKCDQEKIETYQTTEMLCYYNSTQSTYKWESCTNNFLRYDQSNNRKYFCNSTGNWVMCNTAMEGKENEGYQCTGESWRTRRNGMCANHNECATNYCDFAITQQMAGYCAGSNNVTCGIEGTETPPLDAGDECTCNRQCKLGLICQGNPQTCVNPCPSSCETNKVCWDMKKTGTRGCYPAINATFTINGKLADAVVDRDFPVTLELNVTTLSSTDPYNEYSLSNIPLAFNIIKGNCDRDEATYLNVGSYSLNPITAVKIVKHYAPSYVGEICIAPVALEKSGFYFLTQSEDNIKSGIQICADDVEALNTTIYSSPDSPGQANIEWNITLKYTSGCSDTQFASPSFNLTLKNSTGEIIDKIIDRDSGVSSKLIDTKNLCGTWTAEILGFNYYNKNVNETLPPVSGFFNNLNSSCQNNNQCCSGWCANGTNNEPSNCCSKGQCWSTLGNKCVNEGSLAEINSKNHICSSGIWVPTCTSNSECEMGFCHAGNGTMRGCQSSCSLGSSQGVLAAEADACCTGTCFSNSRCFANKALINSMVLCHNGVNVACNTTAGEGNATIWERGDILAAGELDFLCTDNGWRPGESETVQSTKSHSYLSVNNLFFGGLVWLECAPKYLTNIYMTIDSPCRNYTGSCNASRCPAVACNPNDKDKLNAYTEDSNGTALSLGWYGNLTAGRNYLCLGNENQTEWARCSSDTNMRKQVRIGNESSYICDKQWIACSQYNRGETYNSSYAIPYYCDESGWSVPDGQTCTDNTECRSKSCTTGFKAGSVCCPAGQCWDDTGITSRCVASGKILCGSDSKCVTNSRISKEVSCKNGIWKDETTADSEQFSLDIFVFVCDTTTIDECLMTAAYLENQVNASQGDFIALRFEVSKNNQPEQANVAVLLNGVTIQTYNSSGESLKLELGLGTHEVVVKATSPTNMNKTVRRTIIVKPPLDETPAVPGAVGSVESQLDLEQDKSTISQRITQLESKIEELEKNGINVVYAKKLLEKVKIMNPQNADAVTEALGTLDEAERELNSLERVSIKKVQAGIDFGKILIGIIATAIGIGGFIWVMSHKFPSTKEPPEVRKPPHVPHDSPQRALFTGEVKPLPKLEPLPQKPQPRLRAPGTGEI